MLDKSHQLIINNKLELIHEMVRAGTTDMLRLKEFCKYQITL
jgi:hypothetical protein